MTCITAVPAAVGEVRLHAGQQAARTAATALSQAFWALSNRTHQHPPGLPRSRRLCCLLHLERPPPRARNPKPGDRKRLIAGGYCFRRHAR
jgi:hypothetical protein